MYRMLQVAINTNLILPHQHGALGFLGSSHMKKIKNTRFNKVEKGILHVVRYKFSYTNKTECYYVIPYLNTDTCNKNKISARQGSFIIHISKLGLPFEETFFFI